MYTKENQLIQLFSLSNDNNSLEDITIDQEESDNVIKVALDLPKAYNLNY